MAQQAAATSSQSERDVPGSIVGIFTAPTAGAPMEQQGSVVLQPGVGIVGDRYALHTGTWSDPRWPDQELTLFEAETAEAAGIEPGLARRNIVTRGISLEGLIGVRFRIGGAVVAGVRACTPCRYIQEVTGVEGLTRALHSFKGGLRCRVLEAGKVRLGDVIEVLGLEPETEATSG
ncbi:MAG: MOSC domain-containing protein [Chloroflexi bacterium]|nr:MAG: MOSC domain-containing protein [Chloroflexota bacterium]